MNNNIIYELSENIQSSVELEKPLTNWFLAILLPVLLGNMCLTFSERLNNESSIASFFTITALILYSYLLRNIYIRSLRVDKYICRKQIFFTLIKDYYMQNNGDISNNQFYILINNINTFLSFKKRLIPIVKSIIIIIVLICILSKISSVFAFICGLIYFIIFIYYLYIANNIWWEIFSIEKNIYQELYNYLDGYKEQSSISKISVKRMSFVFNIVLSIITFGVYGFYWDYLFHTAPDKTFPYIHEAENDIFNRIISTNKTD